MNKLDLESVLYILKKQKAKYKARLDAQGKDLNDMDRAALENATQALQREAERDNPQPLTLEELKQMGGRACLYRSQWTTRPKRVAHDKKNCEYGSYRRWRSP